MPARASHLPNIYERQALQELKSGEKPASLLGTQAVIAKLLAKRWIERGNTAWTLELQPLERKHCGSRCPTRIYRVPRSRKGISDANSYFALGRVPGLRGPCDQVLRSKRGCPVRELY
jgi:hypothetical protein